MTQYKKIIKDKSTTFWMYLEKWVELCKPLRLCLVWFSIRIPNLLLILTQFKASLWSKTKFKTLFNSEIMVNGTQEIKLSPEKRIRTFFFCCAKRKMKKLLKMGVKEIGAKFDIIKILN